MPREENVYDLGDGVYLSTDKFNFILNKKITTNKSTGATAYIPYSFFGNLEQLYKALVNQKFRDNPDLLFNLEEANKLIDKNCKKLQEISKSIKRDLSCDEDDE